MVGGKSICYFPSVEQSRYQSSKLLTDVTSHRFHRIPSHCKEAYENGTERLENWN